MKNSDLHYITAEDLSIGYKEETIVSGINFELHKGEAIALIGTNGSGKSTLLKTVVNLLKPLAGQLAIFGLPPGENPQRIAYLGQFHNSGFILPLRAIDVVRMGRYPLHGLLGRMTRLDEEIVREAINRMGIGSQANAPLRFLSGGQQQRVYLAQVLAHRADLLVMDDLHTVWMRGRELYLKAVYDELSRGASVVLATHDIQDEASICHQVMLLARKVVAYGPPDKVITPQALLETFGVVINEEKRRLSVIETHHCHDRDDTE
jgi:ABC-type Mn2+/Zn2+ transport system ATPase subunit